MTVGLINSVLMCGGDEIAVQYLHESWCDFKAATKRSPAKITFTTDQNVSVVMKGMQAQMVGDKVGLLVWLPRDKLMKAFDTYSPDPDDEDYAPAQKHITLKLALTQAMDLLGKEEQVAARLLLDSIDDYMETV